MKALALFATALLMVGCGDGGKGDDGGAGGEHADSCADLLLSRWEYEKGSGTEVSHQDFFYRDERLARVEDFSGPAAGSTKTVWEIDSSGRLVWGGGEGHKLEYDDQGRLMREFYGNGDGPVVTIEYDESGRIVRRTSEDVDGTEIWTYVYDDQWLARIETESGQAVYLYSYEFPEDADQLVKRWVDWASDGDDGPDAVEYMDSVGRVVLDVSQLGYEDEEVFVHEAGRGVSWFTVRPSVSLAILQGTWRRILYTSADVVSWRSNDELVGNVAASFDFDDQDRLTEVTYAWDGGASATTRFQIIDGQIRSEETTFEGLDMADRAAEYEYGCEQG